MNESWLCDRESLRHEIQNLTDYEHSFFDRMCLGFSYILFINILSLPLPFFKKGHIKLYVFARCTTTFLETWRNRGPDRCTLSRRFYLYDSSSTRLRISNSVHCPPYFQRYSKIFPSVMSRGELGLNPHPFYLILTPKSTSVCEYTYN